MNFKSIESLQPIVNVVNEKAGAAVNDKSRTIIDSPISDVLSGALGASVGESLPLRHIWFRCYRT